MSEQKSAQVNHLIICFEQAEDENSVDWRIVPDEQIQKTMGLELMDLAECGAPLSAMGIRELLKLCNDGLIHTALETAYATRNGVLQRIAHEKADTESGHEDEEVVIH